MTDTQELIERLRSVAVLADHGTATVIVNGEEVLCDLGKTVQVRNPDGEEAADELERLTTALADAEAKLEKARVKLGWYADQMCEGLCEKDGRIAEAIGEDVCAGCPARATLAELGEG